MSILTDYAEFSKTAEYKLVEGVTGPTSLYKLKRIVANGIGIDLTDSNYYFCKQMMCLVSMGRGGIGTKGKRLALDKYQKLGLRQKMKNNPSFSRSIKVDNDEIRVSALNQI